MEYAGLHKFLLNRPLSELEKSNHLPQSQSASQHPIHQSTVICFNSTYLETIDKYHNWKGFLSGIALIVIVGIFWFYGAIALTGFIEPWFGLSSREPNYAFDLFLIALCSPLFLITVPMLRLEAFRYTHFPLRFNYRHQLVHVFKTSGEVITVPWKDIYFAFGRGIRLAGDYQWDVRGHLLAEDGITVKDTFSIGCWMPNKAYMADYWEFIRRYMEDGPASLHPDMGGTYCLPLDKRRETYLEGVYRLIFCLHGSLIGPLLLSPAIAIESIARFFCNHTSKIPQWPAEVEALCAIPPKDPLLMDSTTHPPTAKVLWNQWLVGIQRARS